MVITVKSVATGAVYRYTVLNPDLADTVFDAYDKSPAYDVVDITD